MWLTMPLEPNRARSTVVERRVDGTSPACPERGRNQEVLMASGPNRWLTWQAKAVGALALLSTFTQFGCHRKPSGGTQPSTTSNPSTPAPPATPSSVADAVNKATEPYWSPAHVLVLPNSPD